MQAKTNPITQPPTLAVEKEDVRAELKDLNQRKTCLKKCHDTKRGLFKTKLYHLQENKMKNDDPRAMVIKEELIEISREIAGIEHAITVIDDEIRVNQAHMIELKLLLGDFQ